MNDYDAIASRFQSSIEAIALSVDELAGPIESASNLLVQCLLDDCKIIACGHSADATLVELFGYYLLNRFENDRPALPCLTLLGTPTGDNASAPCTIARNIRALGSQGDTLVCFSSQGHLQSMSSAIAAGKERNMTVIVLSNANESNNMLETIDVVIQAPATSHAKSIELHMMTIHCLCQLIDDKLFGLYQE